MAKGGHVKMAALMVRERLKYEIEALPEPMAAEVLDFVLFVKARYNEEAYLWQQVEATHDRRRQHPEEVLTVTAAEWDALTAGLESEADGLSATLRSDFHAATGGPTRRRAQHCPPHGSNAG